MRVSAYMDYCLSIQGVLNREEIELDLEFELRAKVVVQGVFIPKGRHLATSLESHSVIPIMTSYASYYPIPPYRGMGFSFCVVSSSHHMTCCH